MSQKRSHRVSLRYHEIAEAELRVLNPFTEDKLRQVGELCRLREGMRHLDLACGKGEMLTTWSDRYGTTGLGVDLSEVFLAAARERAAELEVADRVTFQQGDAGAVELEPESYDIVSCIGATWIGGGLTGTIALLRPALRPGGLMLIGEPFWSEDPPEEAVRTVGADDDFASLAGTLDRFQEAGMSLVELVLADGNSWDRYVGRQWWTMTEWLAANPDDPDAAEFRAGLDEDRRRYLQYLRRYFGWGVFILKIA